MFGKVHDDTLSVHESTFVTAAPLFRCVRDGDFWMHDKAPYPLYLPRFSRFYSSSFLFFFFWQSERRNYFT